MIDVRRASRVRSAALPLAMCLAVWVAGSGCVGFFHRAPDERVRPEVASASLTVREISLRNAAISLKVALAPPDIPDCVLRAVHLQWMINQKPFASSLHALSGQCLSTDHGALGDIDVESDVTFLSLPTFEGPGSLRRLMEARVSVQGTVEVEVAGRPMELIFGAAAPAGQGVIMVQR